MSIDSKLNAAKKYARIAIEMIEHVQNCSEPLQPLCAATAAARAASALTGSLIPGGNGSNRETVARLTHQADVEIDEAYVALGIREHQTTPCASPFPLEPEPELTPVENFIH